MPTVTLTSEQRQRLRAALEKKRQAYSDYLACEDPELGPELGRAAFEADMDLRALLDALGLAQLPAGFGPDV